MIELYNIPVWYFGENKPSYQLFLATIANLKPFSFTNSTILESPDLFNITFEALSSSPYNTSYNLVVFNNCYYQIKNISYKQNVNKQYAIEIQAVLDVYLSFLLSYFDEKNLTYTKKVFFKQKHMNRWSYDTGGVNFSSQMYLLNKHPNIEITKLKKLNYVVNPNDYISPVYANLITIYSQNIYANEENTNAYAFPYVLVKMSPQENNQNVSNYPIPYGLVPYNNGKVPLLDNMVKGINIQTFYNSNSTIYYFQITSFNTVLTMGVVWWDVLKFFPSDEYIDIIPLPLPIEVLCPAQQLNWDYNTVQGCNDFSQTIDFNKTYILNNYGTINKDINIGNEPLIKANNVFNYTPFGYVPYGIPSLKSLTFPSFCVTVDIANEGNYSTTVTTSYETPPSYNVNNYINWNTNGATFEYSSPYLSTTFVAYTSNSIINNDNNPSNVSLNSMLFPLNDGGSLYAINYSIVFNNPNIITNNLNYKTGTDNSLGFNIINSSNIDAFSNENGVKWYIVSSIGQTDFVSFSISENSLNQYYLNEVELKLQYLLDTNPYLLNYCHLRIRGNGEDSFIDITAFDNLLSNKFLFHYGYNVGFNVYEWDNIWSSYHFLFCFAINVNHPTTQITQIPYKDLVIIYNNTFSITNFNNVTISGSQLLPIPYNYNGINDSIFTLDWSLTLPSSSNNWSNYIANNLNQYHMGKNLAKINLQQAQVNMILGDMTAGIGLFTNSLDLLNPSNFDISSLNAISNIGSESGNIFNNYFNVEKSKLQYNYMNTGIKQDYSRVSNERLATNSNVFSLYNGSLVYTLEIPTTYDMNVLIYFYNSLGFIVNQWNNFNYWYNRSQYNYVKISYFSDVYCQNLSLPYKQAIDELLNNGIRIWSVDLDFSLFDYTNINNNEVNANDDEINNLNYNLQ